VCLYTRKASHTNKFHHGPRRDGSRKSQEQEHPLSAWEKNLNEEGKEEEGRAGVGVGEAARGAELLHPMLRPR
jgi:hypothetical protein